MPDIYLRAFIPVVIAILLTACLGPTSPQQVTAAFWQATLSGDPQAAADYSTLSDSHRFDAFGLDWSGYQASWGRIVIDGDTASVESSFTAADKEKRHFTTYLVKQQGTWLVDYSHTAKSVKGGLIGQLLDSISQLGNDLADRFTQSANDASDRLDALIHQLQQRSQTLDQQPHRALQSYTDQLRDNIKALDQSIQNTLNDKQHSLSRDDKKVLSAAANDLQHSLKELDSDSLTAALRNSQTYQDVSKKLETLDNASLDRQKQQWQKLSQELSDHVETLLHTLSGDQQGS